MVHRGSINLDVLSNMRTKKKDKTPILVNVISSAITFPKHISAFICHSGDTDEIVANIQSKFASINNTCNPLIVWSIRDWHTMEHLQMPNCGDCQKEINKEINRADYIIFIVGKRTGHYMLREWFYCMERITKKKVFLFLKKDVMEDEHHSNLIKDVMHPFAYLKPEYYSNTSDIISILQESIPSIHITSSAAKAKIALGRLHPTVVKDLEVKLSYKLDKLTNIGLSTRTGSIKSKITKLENIANVKIMLSGVIGSRYPQIPIKDKSMVVGTNSSLGKLHGSK